MSLLLLTIILPTSPLALDDVTENMVFNGSDSFSTSSYVRSGDGSQADPYIISDYNMGTYTLQILNSAEYVVIRNLTFSTGSSWAFSFTSTSNLIIQNITTDGRNQVIYGSGCSEILIFDCNFSNIRSATDSFQFLNCNDITITDSLFAEDTVTGAGRIHFNNQGSGHVFLRNDVYGVPYADERFLGSGRLINNTFIDSPVTIISGNSGGQIVENIFDSTSDIALTLSYSYRLQISRNFFRGTYGIYFDLMQWQTAADMGSIDNNTFESCEIGINTANNWQTRTTRYNILYNYFGNSTGMAIVFNYGNLNNIWRNIFYHNGGTDNSTAGSQVTQAGWGGSQYENKWTMGTIGNFWANHRTPDVDNNGITDINYTIPTNGLDTRPSTNPYFDTDPPSVVITDPPTGTYPRSYVRLKWDASDTGSGLDSVFFRIGEGPQVEITGKDHHSVFLPKGFHRIKVGAFDRAGLYDESEVQVTIASTEEVLSLEHPADGAYYSTTTHQLRWSVRSYFVPESLTLTIDGAETELSTDARLLTRELGEGQHNIKVKVVDDDGLEFEKEADLIVDLTPPELVVRSPFPDSVISNDFVVFNYSAWDNYGIDRVEVRYDDEPYMDRTEFQEFSDFLTEGPHILNIRVFDLAQIETNLTIPFTVGGESDISIIEPFNGSVTKETTVTFSWEYSGPFPWSQAYLKVGRGVFDNIGGARSKDINLETDGEHQITIRLEDIYGNYIEKTTIVFKDTRSPTVGFYYPQDGQVVNQNEIELSWSATDQNPFPQMAYSLMIDGGEWVDLPGIHLKMEYFEQGEHTLRLRATDKAGNVGEKQITFYVDVTPPTVNFLSPRSGDFIKDSRIDIRWEAFDDRILSNLTLVIDHRTSIDVTDRSVYSTTIGIDGDHTISLIATDIAGNVVNRTILVHVDLLEPEVQWVEEPGGFVGWDWVNLSWTVYDAFGIANLTLMINGDPLYLPVNTTNINITLEEGIYTFEVIAKDLVGWAGIITNSEEFVIDLTPPTLDVDLEMSNVIEGRISVYWTSSDAGSQISITEIDIDGNGFNIVPSGNFYIFENQKTGEHRITIRAKDRSGNEQEVYWDVVVERGSGANGGDDEGGLSTMGLVAIILVGALVVVMIIAVIVSKKRSKPEEKRTIKRPSKIDISLPAANAHASLGQRPAITDLPPASAHRVETREDGSGYIRPKVEKKKERKILEVDGEENAPSPFDDTPPREEMEPQVRSPRTVPPPPSMDDQDIPQIELPEDHGEIEIPEDDEDEEDVYTPPRKTKVDEEVPTWDEDEDEDEEGSGKVPIWGEGPSVPFEEEEEIQDWDDMEEMDELEEFDDFDEWEE